MVRYWETKILPIDSRANKMLPGEEWVALQGTNCSSNEIKVERDGFSVAGRPLCGKKMEIDVVGCL